MSTIKLLILSPQGKVFSGDVDQAIFPGVLGAFAVLPRHAPLISSLAKGKLKYCQNGEWSQFEVEDGFVEVKNNEIKVCIEKVING